MNDTGLLDQILLGRSLTLWLYFLAVWAGTTLILVLARRLAVRYAGRIASRTKNRADDLAVDVIRSLRTLSLAAVGLYTALQIYNIDIPYAVEGLFLVLLAQAALSAHGAARTVADWYISVDPTDQSRVTAVNAILLIGRLVIWAVAFVLALDTLGIDITALVTGLGIGGIAVALAVQNVLKDILAYVSILFDRPFMTGDFLAVGDLTGTVEHIGIKSTRLRSLSGEQLVFTNTDLLESRLRNYKRMYERRIAFGVGVEYSTPAEQLEVIPGIMQSAIESQEGLRFDRAHLKAFDDSAITFEAVYIVDKPDYALYMDAQQAINLAILRAFSDAGIQFAFPTQTLHVASLPTLPATTPEAPVE